MSLVEQDHAALLRALREAGGKLTAEEDVTFEGSRIILPQRYKNEGLRPVVTFLKEKIREDEMVISYSRQFNFRPWDGARATMNAMRTAFGMVAQRPTMTMFGPVPPQLRTVRTGVDSTEQVPWGELAVPWLPEVNLMLGSTVHDEFGPIFQIHGQGPKKYRYEVEGLFNLIEDELRVDSMYRGKAFDGQTTPEFLDLRNVDFDKVVYSEDTMVQLNANIWAMLEHADVHRKLGVSLKRAVVLHGPYGTGKTLAAYLTAKIAVQNGWTFVYCRPGRDDLQYVMSTARLYQPSVVFFEDIDVITADDQGRDAVSQLLDVFDGVKSKGTEIAAVLTTNHIERVHKGVLRSGRIDAEVYIGHLDAQGIQRLVESVVADLWDIDWPRVTTAMAGFLPAFVKEAAERSIRYAIARTGSDDIIIDTDDLVYAAESVRPQLEMMQDAHEGGPKDRLEVLVENLVEKVTRDTVQGTRVVDSDGDEMYTLDVIA